MELYLMQDSLDNIGNSFLLKNSQLLEGMLDQATQKAIGKQPHCGRVITREDTE